MSKISLLAKLECQEGKTEEFEAALAVLVAAGDEEPGLEIYSAHKAEGNTYWFFELYTNAEAMAAHGQGEQMNAAMKALGGLLAGAPEITKMTPVAAKGLDI